MTNARQIKHIFQPLLVRHDDLVGIGGRGLWIKPVRHIALRIFIERSSHANFCVPQWRVGELFIPNTDIKLMMGKYRGYLNRPSSSKEKHWIWSDPSMIADAIDVIEKEVLPLLRSINTLEAHAAFYRPRFDGYQVESPEHRLLVDIALGNLDAARASCRELEGEYRDNKHLDWWLYQNNRTIVMTVAEPLFAGDRAALAKILHGWEADNIRGTKLERYWEPTPFPLETAPE